MARIKASRELEEKAQWDAEAEPVRHTLEAEAAKAAELRPWDENNEELDYYDDVDRDTEMASSQETMPMTSKESNDTAPTSSQETAPMSSQERKVTTPVSSQESMSQEMSMPSLESTTGTTILITAGGTPMEDETCLDRPTMRCTPDEERVLLNPLLAGSLDHLEDMPLGYLNVLVACINEIRKVKASQTPVPSPRAPPGLPTPQPISTLPQPVLMPLEPGTMASLTKAIYSTASNLGTLVSTTLRGCPHTHQTKLRQTRL